jgi:hypothetical protein
LSSPRAGGAASKGPMTLKRKVAHRSGEGTFEDWVDIAVRIFFAGALAMSEF